MNGNCTLYRMLDTGNETLGLLVHDTDVIQPLWSIELPWSGNVPDQSCIPEGMYAVVWIPRTDKHPNGTYRVTNVSGRDLIDFGDVANYSDELLGCIALGTTIGTEPGKHRCALFGSANALNTFLLAHQGKEPFTLTILPPAHTVLPLSAV